VKIPQPQGISPELLASAAGAFPAEAWVAGGWVRDRLLGSGSTMLTAGKSPDADLVIAGDAEAAAMQAADSLGGSFVVLDRARRTYRVALPGAHIDFTEMRGSKMEQDLRRRDFTINAMALPASRILHRLWRRHIADPTGGLRDLAAKVVRPAGPRAFEEDPLRTLRAIRMAASLGFTLSPSTQRGVKQNAHLLARVAAERIRDEFFPILRSRQVHAHLAMAQRLRLMRQVLPETESLLRLKQGVHHRLDAWDHSLEAVRLLNGLLASPQRWAGRFAGRIRSLLCEPASGDRTRADILRFACLLHDIGKPATFSRDEKGVHFYGHAALGGQMAAAAARRMRLSRQEVSAVRTIVENHMRPLLLTGEPVTDRAIRRLIADTGNRCADICALALADLLAGRPSRADARTQRVFTLRVLAELFAQPAVAEPLVNGHEIMKRYHLKPGPMVGRLLEIVRQAQVERGISTKKEAWMLLDRAARTPND
jgi:putative nucleotidyltransferase with HDIG domain